MQNVVHVMQQSSVIIWSSANVSVSSMLPGVNCWFGQVQTLNSRNY